MDDPLKSIPTALTAQGAKERARFMEEYHTFLKAYQQVSLSVLVWGVAPERTSPAAEKRKHIRDRLLALGHNAMFSEDIHDPTTSVSLRTREFAQARIAHLVIILLDDSPGALGEAHDFANHPELAHKVFILAPRKYAEGYSAQGVVRLLQEGYGGVHWYEDEELKACNVSGRAVLRVEARREIEFQWSNRKRNE